MSIEGLQPEKGQETLYVVRALHAKRMWFAEALLSSHADAVRRLLIQAQAWATPVNLPVPLWLSDKHEAFVPGIAAEFPGGPHRDCVHHLLRDVAKPRLEAERHAKVKMRSTVRGLRAIAREGLPRRRPIATTAPTPPGASPAVVPAATAPLSRVPAHQGPQDIPAASAPPPDASEVVRASWSAVRGIRHDEQGGP